MINSLITGIRWCARLLGLAMVIVVLVFVFGSVIEGLGKPAPEFSGYTLLTFTAWGVGLAGLVLALWNERVGVTTASIALSVFNLLTFFNPQPGASYSTVLLLLLVPPGLYLACWWLESTSQQANGI